MPKRRYKFDSKEKAWIREKIWLPVVKREVDEIHKANNKDSVRYFTFCGPLAFDIELLVVDHKMIKENDVVTWEKDEKARKSAKRKFPWLNIEPIQFDSLWTTTLANTKHRFDFDIINLDFTCRPFRNASGEMSHELLGIRELFRRQRISSKSFHLFLTFNANYDPLAHDGNLSLTRVIYDHARRFGFHEGYFRLATKGVEDNHHLYILEALPSIIIRFGYESAYSVSCIFKCFYVPHDRPTRHPCMVSFVFKCEWTNPPLSLADSQRWGGEVGWQHSEQLKRDQLTALKLPIVNVNFTMRQKKKIKK